MNAKENPITTSLNESQTNFLRLLGYLFLYSEKYHKASIVFEFLSIFYPDDIDINTSLAFSQLNEKLYDKSYELSLKIINSKADEEHINRAKIILAKSLWGLNKKEEASDILKTILLKDNKKI